MSKDVKTLVETRIAESIAVKKELISMSELIAEVGEVMLRAVTNGNKIIFFGNGGSAADAQHFAAELVGRYYLERPAIPAMALSVNTSVVTAVANDYSFDDVFVRQLEAVAHAGDVAFGISTSGNSQNVIAALVLAKKKGLATIGLTGKTGGRLVAEVDHCICVPSEDTPRIQEGHELVGHLLCEIVERGVVSR